MPLPTTIPSPDAARRHRHPWYFREALLYLQLREQVPMAELAARLGVSSRRLYRHLNLDGARESRALPLQYPVQYLLELMLDTETKQRLMDAHPWHR